VIKAFVYGTLRVGEYNYKWTSGDIVDEILNVTTTGGIYFVSPHGGYPVAKLDEPGTIIGDILVYPEDSHDWDRIYSMESGAGYVLCPIVVTTQDGEKIQAVAWHYKGVPMGPKIPDGDWARAASADFLSEIS
jgi:gamma-glutamylcyclotransferase (GGCT)/AIG2-like uncharacterized protein YtfP